MIKSCMKSKKSSKMLQLMRRRRTMEPRLIWIWISSKSIKSLSKNKTRWLIKKSMLNKL